MERKGESEKEGKGKGWMTEKEGRERVRESKRLVVHNFEWVNFPSMCHVRSICSIFSSFLFLARTHFFRTLVFNYLSF